MEALLRKLLSALDCSDAELSVLFVDDIEMKELNGSYRNKPKTTDVLSFALQEAEGGVHAGGALGDIVISVDKLLVQAKLYEVTPRAELLRLLIHGTLHLLGYDHEGVSKAEAARMRRTELKLFKELEAEFC